eukprot:TRINITY_DN9036_c0_g4_i2.p1 TRINITY_DN9036_c0_g4~~TRINITY_DN9036_c0_g4_i2.p1  ORF type:complete len:721 (+),score=92.83 TRINITY_DN9036_c0_g4_i2:79-2241(+)
MAAAASPESRRRQKVPVPVLRLQQGRAPPDVCFVSQAGNNVRFGHAICSSGPSLTYSVGPSARPAPRRIVFRQSDRGLEFPGSRTAGTKLPREGLLHLIASLQALCDFCGVEHNFPSVIEIPACDIPVASKMSDARQRSSSATQQQESGGKRPKDGLCSPTEDPLNSTYTTSPLRPLSPLSPAASSPGPGRSAFDTGSAKFADPRAKLSASSPTAGAANPQRTKPSVNIGSPAGMRDDAGSQSVTGSPPPSPRSPRGAPKPAVLQVGDAVVSVIDSGQIGVIVQVLGDWGRYKVELPSGQAQWRERRALKLLPKVALAYDERMMRHSPPGYSQKPELDAPDADLENPERPQRIAAVWRALNEAGLTQHCQRAKFEPAKRSDLEVAHEGSYVKRIESNDQDAVQDELNAITTHVTDDSFLAARLAAGAVLELTRMVVAGDAPSGFAVVRPPGHHAERQCGMGFCLFNNVAIAALHATRVLGVERVLVVDWDVHHGNGVQHILEDVAEVFYVSLHVRAGGRFYPGTGRMNELGNGAGAGRTLNIPWSTTGMGDAEYAAAFDSIVLPVAKAYDPGLVIVSAGFDAADGDPLGACHVTPAGFARMTRQLMSLADGKVVLALEGGYSLQALGSCASACVSALLRKGEGSGAEGQCSDSEPWVKGGPWESLNAGAAAQLLAAARMTAVHWPVLEKEIPRLQRAHAVAKDLAAAELMRAKIAARSCS